MLPTYSIYSEYCLSDICVQYLIDDKTQKIGLRVFPSCKKDKIAEHRANLLEYDFVKTTLGAENIPAWSIEPLVQVKCKGDAYPDGFAQGLTMRNSDSTESLQFKSQQRLDIGDKVSIVTTLEAKAGWTCKHYLEWVKGQQYFTINTEFINNSPKSICLEMLSSFTLGNITPFDLADASERLKLHRFRSFWSNEARRESNFFEDINLEKSWIGVSAVTERYGQVGSMPVKKYFPFAAIEDCQESVFWGVMLAYNGSWQVEIEKKHDFACVSGGLADREFGHWTKQLCPGESLKTPKAILSVSSQSFEDLCNRLTSFQLIDVPLPTDTREPLPVYFNDWCSFWGEITQEKTLSILDTLSQLGIDYYIIDAGWYKSKNSDWSTSHGDWKSSDRAFPKGMKYIADQIKSKGIKPGIWFEFETVGMESQAFKLCKEHFLHRDSFILRSGNRSFWDFRDEFTHNYLNEKVIKMLKDCGFEYLKIDYNESIGIGVDSPDSLGEGLREHLIGVGNFWKQIRKQLPELTIENCSSGGHRLEPLMMSLCDVASSSDAHETDNIPIIAGNLHCLIHPAKSLVWAVIRKGHDKKTISYKMSSIFLGRPVLSGDIADLDTLSIGIISKYLEFYRKVSYIIRSGITYVDSKTGKSMLHPKGWQSTLRINHETGEALLVIHSFRNSESDSGHVELKGSGWRVAESISYGMEFQVIDTKRVCLTFKSDFSSAVILFKNGE